MDGYCIAEIKKILRKAEYTEDVPEKITETVWKEEESEYMSIPVENKKKKGSCVCGSKKIRTYLEVSVNYYKL